MSIIRIIAGFVLVAASFGASAQCVASQNWNRIDVPHTLNRDLGCWSAVPMNGSGGYNLITGIPVVFPQGMRPNIPAGFQAVACTGAERFLRDAEQGLIGAALGTIPGILAHNRQMRSDGALVGGLIGVANAESHQCLVILTNEEFRRGEVTRSGGETRREPAECEVGGEDFGDISKAGCLKIRKALTKTYPEQVTAASSTQQVRPNCEFAADRTKKKWFATEAECKAWDGT